MIKPPNNIHTDISNNRFFFDISNNIDFQVEGYIKNFSQLTNINRMMISKDDPKFIIENGIAKGCDVLIKYKKGEFNLSFLLTDLNRFYGA